MKYVRFRQGAKTAYGILDGETVRELRGTPFDGSGETGVTHALAAVKLLAPCQPPKILAVGRNYRSHLGDRPAPERPEIFYKPVSSLQDPEEPIVIPPDATNVHYEGELVLVIGKPTRDATPDQAREAIFGVTCGNDVSEREWQSGAKKDLQWWRAKGADTFAPCGPVIVTGLDPDALPLTTKVNGAVMQEQTTADLLFDCATVVSFASRFITLEPGDLFYTGTPGNTRALAAGDVVEVTIGGVGTLANPVVGG
jgi:2-keto-4-pentenoate hydratase/2-oxohepta-3-ene-1,7-dioic acid hydratase in catechol pathway